MTTVTGSSREEEWQKLVCLLQNLAEKFIFNNS
jgi:hypothetical protein